MDRAVQILLEGEPIDSSYYLDALRYQLNYLTLL